jgi:hypothetical protein
MQVLFYALFVGYYNVCWRGTMFFAFFELKKIGKFQRRVALSPSKRVCFNILILQLKDQSKLFLASNSSVFGFVYIHSIIHCFELHFTINLSDA